MSWGNFPTLSISRVNHLPPTHKHSSFGTQADAINAKHTQ